MTGVQTCALPILAVHVSFSASENEITTDILFDVFIGFDNLTSGKAISFFLKILIITTIKRIKLI